jgi:hypothetical protein
LTVIVRPRIYVMSDYKQLVATLAAARRNQHITLAALGRRLGGLPPQAVSATLRGDTEMHGNKVFHYAHALRFQIALIPEEGL